MKRIIPTLLAVTLLSSGLLMSTNVFATTIIDDKEYWTLEELLAYDKEADLEREVACADAEEELKCKQQLFGKQSLRDGIGKAWRAFRNDRFIATAINPSAGYIKVLYHNDDISEWLRNNPNYLKPLFDLHIVWLDPDQPSISSIKPTLINLRSYPWYAAELMNGIENPGVHTIYSETEEENSVGWFSANQEIELQAEKLDENTANIIYSAIHIDLVGYNDTFNYSSCVNSPEYKEGMECRILFNADRRTTYAPFSLEEETSPEPTEPTTMPTEPTKPTTKEPIKEPVETISTKPIVSQKTQTEQQTKKVEEKIDTPSATEIKREPLSSQISVPISGAEVLPQKTCPKIEFPWWIIALFVAGNGLILWWFLPNRTKNRQKTKNL